jgi:hypothetical protein
MAAAERQNDRELSNSEGLALLDRQTRKYLSLPAEEFIAKFDAGEFSDSDDLHVRRLAVLIPLGRPDAS